MGRKGQETVGEFLRTAREEAGISLEGAAHRLRPEITGETLRKYEADITEPKLSTFQVLCQLYNVDWRDGPDAVDSGLVTVIPG